MQATVLEQVHRWRQERRQQAQSEVEPVIKSDPELEAGVGHHSRLGIGLPMSYIFAT